MNPCADADLDQLGAPLGRDATMRRPRILAFAYSLAPGAGSEKGAGWIWARMLATIGPTVVIARAGPGDREAAKDALGRLPPDQHPRLIWVDLPKWTSMWQRADATRLQRFEYLLWQLIAYRVARRLHHRLSFDLVWHLTWANIWIGSTASLVGPPFVYGPVGGGVGPPWRLVPSLGVKGILAEVLRAATRKVARYANPLGRISWRRASLVLVQNPETRNWLPSAARSKVVIFPNAVFDGDILAAAPRHRSPPTALFAGRLVPWKGAALAVRAIALCPGWRLIVCGDGPELDRVRRLARQLGIPDRVELRGWQQRDEVLRILREETDVFLFPSLHDEASWAVAEAISAGVPVVCLNRGGPPALGGHAVVASSLQRTIAALAEATMSARASGHVAVYPRDFDSACKRLKALLDERHLLPASTAPGGS